MSAWPSTRAKRVLAALFRIGWTVKRRTGSHRVLARTGWPDLVFSFHDGDEIEPRMLARIAKHSGLTPEDLREPSGAPLGREQARGMVRYAACRG